MLQTIFSLIGNSKILGVLLGASIFICCFIALDRAWLKSELTGVQSELAAVKAGRDIFAARAAVTAKRQAQFVIDANNRLAKAEREIANVPAPDITDRDLAVYECLLRLRANSDCSFAGAPAAGSAAAQP